MLKLASFACACTLVSGLIHSSSSMPSRKATIRLSTSCCIRARAAGWKLRSTYIRPTISPMAPCTAPTPRFQRGRSSSTPCSVRLRKSNWACTKGRLSTDAYESSSLKRMYCFQVSSGVAVNSRFNASR